MINQQQATQSRYNLANAKAAALTAVLDRMKKSIRAWVVDYRNLISDKRQSSESE